MSVINYSDQLKYTGKGYLDAKMMPVNTIDDLKKIPITQRFEGFTVTVLNNGNPKDYWLVGGVANKYWVPKTIDGNHKDLRLILEEGFLKLYDNDGQIGDSVDLNSFFPEIPEQQDDLYISSVDYTISDEDGNKGVFLCFTYSDNTKKYLDMSKFLSNTYEEGVGIVIEGNVISLDEAIVGRLEYLEQTIEEQKIDIKDIKERLTSINNIISVVNENSKKISENTLKIEENKSNILSIEERLDSLELSNSGLSPDGETIGLTNDNKLCVKVLEKNGNMLKIDSHDGNNGLFVSIPVFYEDEELKE